jgi:transposase
MVVVDGAGVPLGSQLASASPAEVKLAESILARINLHGRKPLRVIAERAYDSDPLRERLLDPNMLLIAPHRRGRTKPAFNDGRWLRRYRKRRKIERTFAWPGNYRRLVVRYQNHLLMYQAFFHVACSLITLRYL